MEYKLAKSVAVLAVAGLVGAGSVAYAALGDIHQKRIGLSHQSGQEQGSQGFQQEAGSNDRAEGKGIMDELNLTPEQRTQFMAVDTLAKRERADAVREQIPIKMQELDKMLAEEGSARADANSLMDEVNVLQAEMLSQRMDRYFAMKEILTPEQFAKMLATEIPQTSKKSQAVEEKGQGLDQS